MTKTARQQAYEVAQWIQGTTRYSTSIDPGSIIPVTVSLGYGDISFQLYGCTYKQNGQECFYLVGGTPYEQLIAMVGVPDTDNLCIDFGSPYFIAGYLPAEAYYGMSADMQAQFHAFGPNIILHESNDPWLCEGREVVNLNVNYYSVISA